MPRSDGAEAAGLPEWLTTAQLAEMLQVPAATVRQWRYLKIGPRGVRVGKYVRYRRSDVESWLARK